MIAEILCVGTELLLGDIVNTNAQYLSKRLAEIGVSVYHQTVVGDNEERVKEAYDLAFNRADIVINTGGLGPTKDDLTKEMACAYFNKKLVLHEDILENLEKCFEKMNKPMPPNNKKQAYFPEGGIIIPNHNGTAPGCIINENNKIVVLLPGPPTEMKPMFEETVVPYLSKFSDGVLHSKVLRIMGIGESGAEEKIKDIIEGQKNPTIAPYAKSGEMIFRITSKGKDLEDAKKLIEPMENELRKRFGEDIYGEGEETSIEEVVAKLLMEQHLTIATAESCTGGMVAARLINYSGISEVFMDGAVTYSNEAKMNRLGVKKETLDKYGAVSPQVAEEMALGIAKTSNTNVGISTTGIAGPGGGSEEKPVGLVYIGVAINGKVINKKLNINGTREYVRIRATLCLLDALRRELLHLS